MKKSSELGEFDGRGEDPLDEGMWYIHSSLVAQQ